MVKQRIIEKINRLASLGDDFLFVVNYHGDSAYIRKLSDVDPSECLYDFGGKTNFTPSATPVSPSASSSHSPTPDFIWEVDAPPYADYEKSFGIVQHNIIAGNSYLCNLTCQVPVRCNLSFHRIFFQSRGKYKLLMQQPNASFVCFSPETFLQIRNGRIYSYPMKGTIDASLPHAMQLLMEDDKERAEHATIVDLIRNDLSRVATGVRVDRYRYVDVVHTNKGDILQTSSEVSGKLPDNYQQHLGDILAAQLPAGSITGAPKDKTCQIIEEAETYDRGFYTGIMGIYEKGQLDSAVMIRFIEKKEEGLVFKAGGGITFQSQCRKEYEEVLQKVYLPIR